MNEIIQLRLLPEIVGVESELDKAISLNTKLPLAKLRTHWDYAVLSRTIDARQKQVYYQLRVEVYKASLPPKKEWSPFSYPDVHNAPSVLILGTGPAGYFSALKLLEYGIKPVLLERGKSVQERPIDLKGINVHNTVNPDSNYCFGEGGAGTYSDGKLYTRSKKRGNLREILELFVRFGADPKILVDAHPHIGTNKLPRIIHNMRESILGSGGEVYFSTKVIDFIVARMIRSDRKEYPFSQITPRI